MKKLTFLLLGAFLFGSCSSDDDSNDGKCWGAYYEKDSNGNILWEFRVKQDCLLCGTHTYYECPEPGTCGDYYGEPMNNIVGIWECD